MKDMQEDTEATSMSGTYTFQSLNRFQPVESPFNVSTFMPENISSNSKRCAEDEEFSKAPNFAITFKALSLMPTVLFEKYLLTQRQHLFKMTQDDMLSEVWIQIPMFPALIVTNIRRKHDEELSNHESFIMYLTSEIHKTEGLVTLFEKAYQYASNMELLNKFLSTLSASALFGIQLIFLQMLECRLFLLTEECVGVLMKASDDIPESRVNRKSLKDKLLAASLGCDIKLDGWWTEIDEILKKLYARSTGSRIEDHEVSKTLQYALRRNLLSLKPALRRNLTRFILRNISFETNRSVLRRFSEEKIGKNEDEMKVLLKQIKMEYVTIVATAFGPLFLQLPEHMDSIKNRIVVMKSLLFHMHPIILYKKQRQCSIFPSTVECHADCYCGYTPK